ncbi:Acid trehalase-like protein 1 [Hypsibius exemplaris]|uniref:Protein-glucosylgalactosylhydroxylysine glucosidase n=1 Tax=Hypsibius exemplaris TaxID=2072580 RepID=A0A9X6NFI6_HYPEX|nr:Acid trehalase-like protein 1 [Hypsibius exemplaris]
MMNPRGLLGLLAGSLLVSLSVQLEHWSQIPYKFETTTLPAQKYMPEVGNGHIATMVNGANVFMNGLYNGVGPASSRARIPSLVAFQVRTTAVLVNETFTLDVRRGTFKEVRTYSQPHLVIEREIYAHREIDRVLVAHVTISRKAPSGQVDTDTPVEVWIDGLPDTSLLLSTDVTFQPTTIGYLLNYDTYSIATGQTNLPEVPGPVSTVAVAWKSTIQNVTVNRGDVITMSSIISIGVDSNDAIMGLFTAVEMPYDALLQLHSDKWESYFNTGFIYVDPQQNFQLAQTIYGSFYYLLSSIPNKQDPKNRFIGLSPGGLARGPSNTDYSGHVFWDQDTWMYPAILNFHPEQARLLIESRTGTLAAAKANAQKDGYQGAKFAWESAFTGIETSPWPPSGLYEIHITGDVALAVRQFLYVTDDKLRVIRELKLDEMAVEIATFWQSRAECDDAAGVCGIFDVMGPDEYHSRINNSVYTNYAAKLSLDLPAYVLNITGDSHPDLSKWAQTSSRLTYPTAIRADGKKFHLEFDGFTPGVWHPSSETPNDTAEVKQADVILLAYPFGMEMSAEMRQTDLEVYRPITDPHGPAMTWGMFALGYLELGHPENATELFDKNYENVVQPFGVWSEVPNGGGALNFLTGMGGYLQAIVNGYAGVRLMADHVTLHPQALPKTSSWKLVGYRHLGYRLDIAFDFAANVTTIETIAKLSTTHLVLALESGAVYDLSRVGHRHTVHLEKGVLRTYNPATDVLTTDTPSTDGTTPGGPSTEGPSTKGPSTEGPSTDGTTPGGQPTQTASLIAVSSVVIFCLSLMAVYLS